MGLEKNLRSVLTSYIKNFDSTPKRIQKIVNDIEEIITTSPLFKALKDVCDSDELKDKQHYEIRVENEVNGIHCSVGFQQTPTISIYLYGEFRFVIFPTEGIISIKVFFDDPYHFENLFSYYSNVDDLYTQIKQIDKGYEKIVENTLLRILSYLKNDKALDHATESLITIIRKYSIL